VRTLATLGRAAREQAGINVRQPLARMVCVAPNASAESLAPLLPVLASELNVKRVEVATSADALVTLEAKPNFRALGKKFGKRTPLAADAVSQFTSDHLRRFEQGEELVVTVDGDSHEITADDLTIVRRASGALVVQEEHGYFAAIDPAVTSELRQEGMARELISRVQRMRRDAGLAVSDRIRLGSGGDAWCSRQRRPIGSGSPVRCSPRTWFSVASQKGTSWRDCAWTSTTFAPLWP
jgi:isoleucyl-tRNA synthetase